MFTSSGDALVKEWIHPLLDVLPEICAKRSGFLRVHLATLEAIEENIFNSNCSLSAYPHFGLYYMHIAALFLASCFLPDIHQSSFHIQSRSRGILLVNHNALLDKRSISDALLHSP